MKFLNNKKTGPLKNYLKSSQELNEEVNADVEHMVQEADEHGGSLKRKYFWSSWPRWAKTGAIMGGSLALIFILFSVGQFLIKPQKTNSKIRESWHEVVLQSEDVKRRVESSVDLVNTRNLVDAIYQYNKILSSEGFKSENTGGLFYDSGKMDDYANILRLMEGYLSESADLLSEVGDSRADIGGEDDLLESFNPEVLEGLKIKGQDVLAQIKDLVKNRGLGEEVSDGLFELDKYITSLKNKTDEIRQQKVEEELKKAAEQQAAEQKSLQELAEVNSLINVYGKSIVNGNENGVRATLTQGYQSEYDFGALKADQRSTNYPESFRILSVDKDGGNYKVVINVAYVSVYTDQNGDRQQNKYPSSEAYRVVYSQSAGAWKIDGRIFSQ